VGKGQTRRKGQTRHAVAAESLLLVWKAR